MENLAKVPPVSSITRIQAMEAYISAETAPHPTWLARRFKVSGPAINEWMREDEWVAARALRQKEEKTSKAGLVGLETAEDEPIAYYKAIQTLRKELEAARKRNSGNTSVSSIRKEAECLSLLIKMENDAAKALKLR